MAANGTHTSEPEKALPIVIAGGGCVGLFLALLISQSSIPNSVLVFEPNRPDTGDTRAMAHQPLIFPLFARAGLMPALSSAGTFAKGICFRKSVANGSDLLAGKQFKEGDKAQLLLPQWKFQEILAAKVKDSEKGEVKIGSSVEGFEEKDGHVTVQVRDEVGNVEHVDAQYLIGADGAKSTVRKTLNVPLEGETLDSQLVATDIRYDFSVHGFYDANFVIDPENYGLIGKINEDGLWRVSYGVPMDTHENAIYKDVDEKLEKMLPGPKPLIYEITRIAPYKAQQRCAETFWRGRVGLCGDAAHLTNPYAGLGLASGIADAASLADVLESVIVRGAQAELFQSWSKARREKFLSVVDKPSRMAFQRVRTQVDSQEDVDALFARDPLMKGLKEGMPVMPPTIVTKGEELEGWA